MTQRICGRWPVWCGACGTAKLLHVSDPPMTLSLFTSLLTSDAWREPDDEPEAGHSATPPACDLTNGAMCTSLERIMLSIAQYRRGLHRAGNLIAGK